MPRDGNSKHVWPEVASERTSVLVGAAGSMFDDPAMARLIG